MSYDKVRKAAEDRMAGDSGGAWKLADALVTEVPERHSGPIGKVDKTDEFSVDVNTKLVQVAESLATDEIETPAGAPYTPEALRVLRLVALAWPREQRHAEAAFRTHQEAGTDRRKREILEVLCWAARDDVYTNPHRPTLEIGDDAWLIAVRGIERKVRKGMRYPVSANDLRSALSLKPNVPAKDPDEDGATALDAIEALQESNDRAAFAVRVLSRSGEPVDDVREAVEGLIERLLATIDLLRSYLMEGGITDEKLQEILEKGSNI